MLRLPCPVWPVLSMPVLLVCVSTVLAQPQSSDPSAPLRGGYRFGFSEDSQRGTGPQVSRPPGGKPLDGPRTFVDVTILTPSFGGALESQRWAKALSDLGIDVRFRQAIAGDKPEVSEKTRGTLRTVTLVGALGSKGTLEFPDRGFGLDEANAFAEWVDELKTYGAQGAPEGQPLWGLSRLQFNELFEALSEPATEEVEDLPLKEALSKLPLPAGHSLVLQSSAEAYLAKHPPGVVKNRLEGFSGGTALAIALQEAGLGFRPLRNPAGQIQLVVQPLDDISDPWPVGWPIDNPINQSDYAPAMFKFVEIGFDEVSLQDVLDAAAAAIEVPIIVNEYKTQQAKVDLETHLVSYRPQKTTWSLMINSCIRQAGLVKEVRTDEAGRAFVAIEPFVPQSLKGD